MSQITLYLDHETERAMKAAAQAAGLSMSKWVADMIREKTAREWPDSFRSLAGAWREFPDAEELRAGMGKDIPREPF